MAELKTKENDANVEAFLATVADEQQRADCFTLLEIFSEVTGSEAKMWGSSIVGFGHYHYVYRSGREGDRFLAGFAPRKRNLTLYIMSGFDAYEALMGKLGKHTTGKSCLYIKRLSDVDLTVLRELVASSVQYVIETNSVESK